MPKRICIKLDQFNDKNRRKLRHRENKHRNRAKFAKEKGNSKFNKPEHSEQRSYKPRPTSTRQTRSYQTLSWELKKIEDEYDRMFWEQIEIMEQCVREQEQERLRRQQEHEERDRDECGFQLCKPQVNKEVRDPRYIGELEYNDVSELIWGGGEEDCWEWQEEKRKLDYFNETGRMPRSESEEFQFWNW